MNIITIPLGTEADVKVSEQHDTLSITVDAKILGTPETATLNFPLVTLLTMIASAITNPILATGFRWLAALL